MHSSNIALVMIVAAGAFFLPEVAFGAAKSGTGTVTPAGVVNVDYQINENVVTPVTNFAVYKGLFNATTSCNAANSCASGTGSFTWGDLNSQLTVILQGSVDGDGFYVALLDGGSGGSGSFVNADVYIHFFRENGNWQGGSEFQTFIDTAALQPGLGLLSTSTTRAYCQEFATSTGLWDDLTSGFARGICNVAVFLFVPSDASVTQFVQTKSDMTENRLPFAWFADVREAISTGSASTTEDFLSLELASSTALAPILGGDGGIVLLSTETISQYLSDETRELFRSLIAVVLWLLALGYIIQEIRMIWHRTA